MSVTVRYRQLAHLVVNFGRAHDGMDSGCCTLPPRLNLAQEAQGKVVESQRLWCRDVEGEALRDLVRPKSCRGAQLQFDELHGIDAAVGHEVQPRPRISFIGLGKGSKVGGTLVRVDDQGD